MSWVSIESHWRCPNCETDNMYYMNHQYLYIFQQYPEERYSRETCSHCGKEYYVSRSEPNPYSFRLDKGPCKNDYIKDLVLSTEGELTVIGTCVTS